MITLIFTLLLGAWLRFYNNTAIALWHDEAFSALYLTYPWGEMMHRIILDVHPPLYYILLRFWSYIFGDSLLALRLLSILFGVATIYAVYLLVKQSFKQYMASDKLHKWALFASLLVVVSPFQIQYALEARMYTLGTFLAVLSTFFLLKSLETNRYKFWLTYAILAAAAMYTHYFLFFTIAAQVLYIFYDLIRTHGIGLNLAKSKRFINTILAGLVIGVLYLPWLPSFLEQNQRVQESFWIPPMNFWSIPSTIWKMSFGGGGSNNTALFVTTVVAVLIVYHFMKKTKESVKWLLFLNLLIPFIGAILISITTDLYLDRYFVFASTFFSIIIALAALQIPKFAIRRTVAALVIVISLVAFFKNWQDMGVKDQLFGSNLILKPGMAKASETINTQSTKNDKIYVGSSFVFFTFKYYNETGIAPKLISSGSLDTIPHFSGTAILTDQDLILDLGSEKKNDRIWLLWTTGFGSSKPNVPGNWSLISEKEFDDAPGFKGKIIVTEYRVD